MTSLRGAPNKTKTRNTIGQLTQTVKPTHPSPQFHKFRTFTVNLAKIFGQFHRIGTFTVNLQDFFSKKGVKYVGIYMLEKFQYL